MKLSEAIASLSTYQKVHGDVPVKIISSNDDAEYFEEDVVSMRLVEEEGKVVHVLLIDQAAAESL